MQTLKESYAEAVGKLRKLKNQKIAAAYLFGSYLTDPKKARDVDICIIGNLTELEMAELSLLFDKPVDISFMERMPFYVAINVLRGRPIFVRDRAALSKKWMGVVRENFRLGRMRSRIYEGVNRWMSSGTAQTD